MTWENFVATSPLTAEEAREAAAALTEHTSGRLQGRWDARKRAFRVVGRVGRVAGRQTPFTGDLEQLSLPFDNSDIRV